MVAVAISQSALDFPTEHPFWGPFTVGQDRDIVAALSSLGFRFDGLGGWADERVPSQRDLSMAMGSAGRRSPAGLRRSLSGDSVADGLAGVDPLFLFLNTDLE